LPRFFALLLLALPALAQDRIVNNNFHTWMTYDGHHPFRESKWQAHLEGHWRRHDGLGKWQQLLLRPGLTYAFSPKFSATFGYAFIETWPYGPNSASSRFPEHRLWEQVYFTYRSGKASWGSRIRFENRWLGGDGWRYENRLRLMQRMSLPLSKATYFITSNEFWIFVKPYRANSWFDQNRAYAAIGWKLAEGWRLETGYMNQAVLRRSGLILESNHTLRLTLLSDAAFGLRRRP
jgi:hypothetical protein